jgi:asparagine synthase (glutamine-hydrolysing)
MLEDILIKVDRMSMMHALEVRSPFLDYRLVELGLEVPARLRTKNGCNKYLLRRLAARRLPGAVCRAPKRGFGIPLKSWLYAESSARSLAATLVETPDAHLDPFVRGGAERLWHLGQTNSAVTSAVVQLLCYRWWCLGR